MRASELSVRSGRPRPDRRSLIFLSYGLDPVRIGETKFAVLSAMRRLRERDAVEIVIYTDAPRVFTSLGVEAREIRPEELAAWRGPTGYGHRVKPMVLRDALRTRGGSVVLADSDTWFKKSPARLFSRVGPGRACLHLAEGPLSLSFNPDNRRLADSLSSSPTGRLREIPPNLVMWNSGVVGVHESDVSLVDDALAVLDDLLDTDGNVHTVEQVALSFVLANRALRLRPTNDIVFHYWWDGLRRPFTSDVLIGALERTEHLPPRVRAAELHPLRPRLRFAARLRHSAKEAYRFSGLRWTRGGRTRSSAT